MALTLYDAPTDKTSAVIFDKHSRALFDDKWHTIMVAVSEKPNADSSSQMAMLFVDCGFKGMCEDCLYRDEANVVSYGRV